MPGAGDVCLWLVGWRQLAVRDGGPTKQRLNEPILLITNVVCWGSFLFHPATALVALFVALLTVCEVSGNETITVPVSLRGQKLIGSVYIGNQAFDMGFGMSSDDVWVFGVQLQDQLQKMHSFSHHHFYMKSNSLKMNDADSYFESAEFEHNTRAGGFIITGKNAFEDFSFRRNKDDGKDTSSFKKPVPMGIVDKIDGPFKSVSFDYDGMFGLWPWKDDSPECPMLEWTNVEQYTDHCLALFGQKKASYFYNLPKMKYSLHLSGTGDSGELVLGGYDASKIDGPVACEPINRFRASMSEPGWYHTLVSLRTPFFYGKRRLTAERKRKPIREAIIDIEVSGLQVPLPKSVLPSISEEDEQQNASHERDQGYFIPCSKRNKVTDIGFYMGENTRVSITGHDMFIPSNENPSWCKMVINQLPRKLANKPVIVLGDVFFKKYVTIFDFERGRGKTTMCVGTPKDAALLGGKEEEGGTKSSSAAGRHNMTERCPPRAGTKPPVANI